MSDAVRSPSTFSLTDQQRRALAVTDASVALSAGAGCGKTMVLTERFLAALEESGGRPLRGLVALTFTEKAARELRRRIRDRCRARLVAGEDARRWWTILRGLDAAPIGTFHEFCARLLRRHALQVGVDPEFAIFDEAIAGALRDEAVRAAMRRLLAAHDPDLIELATDYGLRQVREALGRLAGARGAVGLEAWSQQDPQAIVDRWRSLLDDRLWPAVRGRAGRLVGHCRHLLEAMDCDHARIRERRAAVLESLKVLDPGAASCPADRLDELVELLRVNDLPRKGSWPSEEIYEEVKQAFTALREHIKDQIKPALAWDEPEARAAAERSLQFARLALAVRRENEQLKRRRRGLDFDDLLILSRDLLRDHPEVALADRDAPDRPVIEFVLVDEFQDTDGVQGEVLRLLSGSEFLSGRLFLVGDVKQSIYRFRGAEPSIFHRWRSEFPQSGRLHLTENFRSVPGVIRFINALFGEEFLDVDPVDEPGAGHRLLPIRREDTCQPAVEFLWPAGPDPRDEPATKPPAHQRRMIEARGLARRLRQRLDEGWPIFDRTAAAPRPAHAGDIALLFRAMTDLWPYESALADAGFDYHTIGGSAFYAQQEVHDVINLLSVVEDPFDEVALAGALRSPFFGVSDEGLFWLATTFEDGGLTAGIHRLDEITQLSPRDRQRTARALDLLSRWRAGKDRVPMAQLVAQALDESGFEAALVCEFLGERKLANTRKIVRLARDFDQQGGFTLGDFVARLRADLENEPREEQAATTDEAGTSIRLMSIHQAKGLEFPIVVLPDLARAPSSRSPLVACHPELGLVVRPPQPAPGTSEATVDPTTPRDFAWQAYLTLERADDERESLRLFYVAATRARDALVLSAGLAPDEPAKASSVALRLLDERFDRRTGRCRVALAEPGAMPAVQVRLMDAPNDPDQDPQGAATEAHPLPAPLSPDRQGGVNTLPLPHGHGSEGDRRRAGASIASIEATITRAVLLDRVEDESPVPPPRYLDLDPTAGLPPRAARLDRLIRSILGDPRWLQGAPLEDVAARAATRQMPAANSALIREALRRLRPWLDRPSLQGLHAADPASIHRDLAFALPDPPDGPPTTVLQGTCDLVFRDRQGRWHLLVVADARTSRARQGLRLQLAALAAPARGFTPVHQGWLIWHGPDRPTTHDIEPVFDSHARAAYLAELTRSGP
jgi:ATP-dependent helicase/nuclease subunit A